MPEYGEQNFFFLVEKFKTQTTQTSKTQPTFKKRNAVAVLMQLESMKCCAFDVGNLKVENPKPAFTTVKALAQKHLRQVV